jgi:hypothetical protein
MNVALQVKIAVFGQLRSSANDEWATRGYEQQQRSAIQAGNAAAR